MFKRIVEFRMLLYILLVFLGGYLSIKFLRFKREESFVWLVIGFIL